MASLKRHDDVQALTTGCFHEAGQSDLFQKIPNLVSTLDDLWPGKRRLGVETKKLAVLKFNFIRLRAPNMNFNRPDLGKRNEIRNFINDQKRPGAAALFDR